MPNPDRKRKWRKRMKWLLAISVLGVMLWLLASYVAVCRLTHRAEPSRPEPTPTIAWGAVSPHRLTTAGGNEVGAWFLDGAPDRPLVLLLHGNGASRSACLPEAELAAKAGSPVLMISFRAHGDSTGEVNDFGYSGRQDVMAAMDWLRERHPGRPVVIWGRSLGAAAALFAAEELGNRVSGYILECPYQDLRTATRNRTRMYLPPVLEFVAYLGFAIVVPAVLPDIDAISPLKAAPQVPASARVLILAGSADQRARPEEAEAIAKAIGGQAELVIVEGGDHLQLAEADPKGYQDAILGFLANFARTIK